MSKRKPKKVRATPADVLRRARELIATPEQWTQGVAARDDGGASVAYMDPEACKFCMLGAVWRAGADAGIGALTEGVGARAEATLRASVRGHLADFNDHPKRRHATVLKAFDRAILLAGGTLA